jgi:hypothetical protein
VTGPSAESADQQVREIAQALRNQADACATVSPLYEALLGRFAADLADGGPTAAVLLPSYTGPSDAPALRLLGAVHRLVLAGEAPELAAYFPTACGDGAAADAWPAARRLLDTHGDVLAREVRRPVQTNEPGRAAVLYGILLTLAYRTGLPVRLLEIGASAGLNLQVDRFGYRVETDRDFITLGDPKAALVIDDPWRGLPPVPAATLTGRSARHVRILERSGCDPRPLDVSDPSVRALLESFVWADDPARLMRVRAACEIAATTPAPVDEVKDTADWLEDRLADGSPGMITVVWHSIMRQYVPADAWIRIEAVLAEAGAAASADAPLALAAFEPDTAEGMNVSVRLTTWPGDGPQAELLATAGPHGTAVRWGADAR